MRSLQQFWKHSSRQSVSDISPQYSMLLVTNYLRSKFQIPLDLIFYYSIRLKPASLVFKYLFPYLWLYAFMKCFLSDDNNPFSLEIFPETHHFSSKGPKSRSTWNKAWVSYILMLDDWFRHFCPCYCIDIVHLLSAMVSTGKKNVMCCISASV